MFQKAQKFSNIDDENVVFFNQHDNYLIGSTNKDNLIVFRYF